MPSLGIMRNLQINNIMAYGIGNSCSSITGLSRAKIENIYLSNIRFVNKGGLAKGNYVAKDAETKGRHDIIKNMYRDRYWASFCDVQEDENGYPQPTIWKNLPSFGLFIRNVKDVVVDNCTFFSEEPDPRPFAIAVNVDRLQLNKVYTKSASKFDIILNNVYNYDIDKQLKIKIEK